MVVSLRSGGPKMTVEAVADELITCVWFDRRETMQARDFPVQMLQRGSSRIVMIVPAGLEPADVKWEREMREAGAWND